MTTGRPLVYFGHLRVYRSSVVEKGGLVIMGNRAAMPERWKSMTRNEQLRWALLNATAIILNPRDEIPKMHEVKGH